MPSLWLLAALMLVMGLAAGSIDVGGNTLLVWIHGDQAGPRMNALHFFFGVGALLAPIFVAQAIGLTGGVTWAYWLLALLVLPAMVLFLRLPSPVAPARIAQARSEPIPWLPVGLMIAGLFALRGRRDQLRRLDLHLCSGAGPGHCHHSRLPDLGVLGRADPGPADHHSAGQPGAAALPAAGRRGGRRGVAAAAVAAARRRAGPCGWLRSALASPWPMSIPRWCCWAGAICTSRPASPACSWSEAAWAA
ncbi:MAG: MFS transporter [Anaerolineae bacterium]